MSIKNLDHLNLTVTDFDQTRDWYKRIFGFELVEQGLANGIKWGILKSGDAMLCIYEHPEFSQLQGSSKNGHTINHFGLRIIDQLAWEALLKQEKIEIEDGPVCWPHSTSWYLADPNGYEIEVACWRNDQVAFAA